MNNFFALCILITGFISCHQNHSGTHAHNADGSHPVEELQTLSYTLYTDKSELFVEFKPLIAGKTSKFAAHLTLLGDNFLPYTEGTVTISFLQNDKGIKATSTAPGSPGIFQLALQPSQSGMGKLVFDIQTKNFSDRFVVDSVQVFADEATAIAAQPKEDVGTDISFLKEQAWKIDFANAAITRQTMFDVVKATGEIFSAPGDEVTVVARSNGIVKFTGSGNVIGAPVSSGQTMFSITGGEIAFENIAAAKEAANAEQATAKAEYERAEELINDKLITQAEYQNAKLRYEKSRIAVSNLLRNYSGGNRLIAPISGFIKNVIVSDGQYVAAGQPLAIITKNQKLLLKVEVSLRDADRIQNIQGANFTLIQSKVSYSTQELNGKLISVGKTTGNNVPLIPVYFEISNLKNILPGSYAEVYLQTNPMNNVLAIPLSAIIEEQGVLYAYVQTAGESFQKREIKTGANDGRQIQILSGIIEGERVVIKGAYQIKLSQASGAMPAHDH